MNGRSKRDWLVVAFLRVRRDGEGNCHSELESGLALAWSRCTSLTGIGLPFIWVFMRGDALNARTRLGLIITSTPVFGFRGFPQGQTDLAVHRVVQLVSRNRFTGVHMCHPNRTRNMKASTSASVEGHSLHMEMDYFGWPGNFHGLLAPSGFGVSIRGIINATSCEL